MPITHLAGPLRISAIVVTHGGGRLLQECLDSLAAQNRPIDELLVVVSNHPIDVAAPALQLGENVGYARASNAGVAATSGEILLLNDDTRLHPSCVAELARAWHGNGVYQPRILLADGSGRMDNLGLGFFADGGVWARGRGGPDVEISGVPGCFSGAAVLFARTWWEALGGFDEGLGNFCEDVDLSLRMMRRGWSITPVPAARVEHHLGASWGRSSDKKIRLIERNRVRAGVRSLPSSALLAMPVTTLSRLALFWATQRAGRGAGRDVSSGGATAAMRGIAEGIAAIPEALARRRADRPQWRVGEVEMLGRMWQGRARMVDLWRA